LNRLRAWSFAVLCRIGKATGALLRKTHGDDRRLASALTSDRRPRPEGGSPSVDSRCQIEDYRRKDPG